MTSNLLHLAAALGQKLKAHEWKIAIAESCTGGGLGFWITSVEGSSEWFDRGFITYSNQSKEEMLGIEAQLIHQFGAVSKEIVKKMAELTLSHSHAQISIAITGIAGPSGGSIEKPVGTVWSAWARKDADTLIEHYIFKGDRQSIREQAIITIFQKSLEIL